MIHVPSDAETPGQLHRVHCPDRVTRWVCADRFKDLVDQTVFSNLGLLLKTPQWYYLKYIGVLNLRFDCCTQVKVLCKALIGTNVIEVILYLGWSLHKSDLREVLSSISDTNVVFLEFKGLSSDTVPMNDSAHSSNVFLVVMENSNLQLITLLDFPAPSLRVSYLSEPNNPEFSGYQLEYTMNVDGLAPT